MHFLQKNLAILAGLGMFALAGSICSAESSKPIRIGIIGVDTTHASEFTKILNRHQADGPMGKCQVVAAYLGGTPDVPKSVELGKKHGISRERIRQLQVRLMDKLGSYLRDNIEDFDDQFSGLANQGP